nr:MAG TPA_asm: hypothetical protein [Caudoviricetes sp.]
MAASSPCGTAITDSATAPLKMTVLDTNGQPG